MQRVPWSTTEGLGGERRMSTPSVGSTAQGPENGSLCGFDCSQFCFSLVISVSNRHIEALGLFPTCYQNVHLTLIITTLPNLKNNINEDAGI